MNIIIIAMVVIILIPIILIILGSKRYGQKESLIAVGGCVIISLIISIITFQVIINGNNDSIEKSIKWEKVVLKNEKIKGFEYKSESGLYGKTQEGEVRITGIIPICLTNGEIIHSDVREVEVAEKPFIKLPSSEKQIIEIISFNIYPKIEDTMAASSFIILENGEVWCTERLEVGGPSAGVAVGAAAFLMFMVALIVFIASLILLLIIVIIILEIILWKRNMRNKSII
jgi:hypothetical protein